MKWKSFAFLKKETIVFYFKQKNCIRKWLRDEHRVKTERSFGRRPDDKTTEEDEIYCVCFLSSFVFIFVFLFCLLCSVTDFLSTFSSSSFFSIVAQFLDEISVIFFFSRLFLFSLSRLFGRPVDSVVGFFALNRKMFIISVMEQTKQNETTEK